MGQLPLGIGAYSRPFGKMPEIRCENRFFEQNPVGAEKVSLLSRPGTKEFLNVGDGPIRTLYAQPGVFGGDLFIVSGTELFRYDGTTVTQIAGELLGTRHPVISGVAIPGWEAIFITDGVVLQHYAGSARSTGTLTVTGSVSSADVVRIGNTYYRFTAANVNAGTPSGEPGDPWLVALGGSAAESLANLFDAINLTGLAGTTYSSAASANPDVRAYGLTDTAFQVRTIESGPAGDAIVTTTTSSGLAWGAGTLSGGSGGQELVPCPVPDGVSVSDLATLASHVICVERNSRRFYWIRPGEVSIQALDFSSAESEPDHIVNVAAVGDQFWLFGQSSTESWYASGDADQPFLRAQGRAFSQGIIPGTLARVNESIFVVGKDMVVYRIAGSPERISHHGIEERIRNWQERLPEEPPEPSWPSLWPATLNSAVWSRTAADSERVTLSITPLDPNEDVLIWRRPGTSGAWTNIHTLEAPYDAVELYADTSISGESTYQYALSTGAGDRGPALTVWTGPVGIPLYESDIPFGAGYRVDFAPANVEYATDLEDEYNNAGGIGSFALRATADAGETDVFSGVLANVPNPNLTFRARLRHKVTSFGVDDYGQYGVEFDVTVPESE